MKKHLYHEKALFTLTIFLIILKTIFSVLLAFILKEILDIASSGTIKNLFTIAGYFIILSLLEPGVGFLQEFCKSKYIKETLLNMKNDIFENLTKRDIADFNKKNTGEYISLLTNDINIIEQSYLESIFQLIANVFSFLLGTAALLKINIYITLIIFSVSTIILLIPILFKKVLSKYQRIYSDSLSIFITKVKDIFLGFEVIKGYNIEDIVFDEFKNSNTITESSKMKLNILNSLSNNISSVAGNLMFVASLSVGAYFAVKGIISVGSSLAIMQLVNNIVFPMTSASSYLNRIKSTTSINEKVTDFTSSRNIDERQIRKQDFNDEIVFNSVKFSYEENKDILKEVSLKFEKGKKYAIMGKAGCGKSTLIKMLLGYYNNFEGSITIYGIDINEICRTDLYCLISMIQQNIFIFDDTLKNNITLFNNYSEKEIQDIINFIELDKIDKEDKGEIGENGVKLSGGERQRIAIGRAVIKTHL